MVGGRGGYGDVYTFPVVVGVDLLRMNMIRCIYVLVRGLVSVKTRKKD